MWGRHKNGVLKECGGKKVCCTGTQGKEVAGRAGRCCVGRLSPGRQVGHCSKGQQTQKNTHKNPTTTKSNKCCKGQAIQQKARSGITVAWHKQYNWGMGRHARSCMVLCRQVHPRHTQASETANGIRSSG